MKNCPNFEPLLSLFANRELEPETREAVASHLATCAACRQKVEGFREIKMYLAKLPAPDLPENLFADFSQGVADKILHRDETLKQRLGLVALLYALYRRQRLVIAVAALVLLLALPTWLAQERHSHSASLAQLLEKRDWTGLYYAMLNSDSRMRLLNEPIPVSLAHSALNELMNAQRENPKLRAGLQQVLSKIKTPAGNSFRLSHSAQILGKISASGFEPARRSARIVWNPESVLFASAQAVTGQTITMRALFSPPNFEGNKL